MFSTLQSSLGLFSSVSRDRTLATKGDTPMQRNTKWIVTGAIVLAVLAVAVVGGARVAVGASNGDRDGPITGNALDKASAAALQSTGAGRVTGTEIGDEEGYYEV